MTSDTFLAMMNEILIQENNAIFNVYVGNVRYAIIITYYEDRFQY